MPPTTTEKEFVKKSDYETAIFSQGGCNLSGLVHDLSRTISKIWDEAHEKGHGTDWVNEHPIVKLYVEQMAHLCRKINYLDAYKVCEEKSNSPEL